MPVWEFVKIIYLDIKMWTIIKILKLVIIGKRRNMDCIFLKDTKKRREFKRLLYTRSECVLPHKNATEHVGATFTDLQPSELKQILVGWTTIARWQGGWVARWY